MSDNAANLTEIPKAWWPGIIKLRHDKLPALKKWNENAISDYADPNFDAEIREFNVDTWIAAGHPVGLVVPEGFMVIDCDSEEAVAWLESVAPEGTPIVKRHSASAHFFFRYDDEQYPFKAWTQLCVGVALEGAGKIIDLRIGGRSQTVIPPSMHDDGRRYQWIEQLPRDREFVPMLPDDVAAELWDARPKKEMSVAHVDVSEQPGYDRIRSYIGRLCRYESTIEAVDAKAAVFAIEVYGDRPERLKEHRERDHGRLVSHMWDQWGGSAPLAEMDNDRAIIELFQASDHASRWVYLYELKKLFRCERGVWVARDDSVLRRELCDFSASLWDDANRETANPDRRERLAALSLKLRQQPRVVRVAKMLMDLLSISSDEFELNPWLIPFPAGVGDRSGVVLDLEAGEVRELVPADHAMHTMGVPHGVEPDWSAVTPFLEATFPDEELRTFVQRAAGLSMLGRVFEEHVFFFLYGRGQTGKSTFLNMLRAAFGDLARFSDFRTFCDNAHGNASNATPDISMLRGSRLVTCSEIPDKALLGAKMKTLTGEERIVARGLYQDAAAMPIHFTAWVAGNVRPEADALDSGVERRLKIIPVNRQVTEVDTRLGAKLSTPGSLAAIVEWAGEGLEQVLAAGGTLGADPVVVKEASQDYWQEMNPLDAWEAANAVADPAGFVSVAELTSSLDEWGHEEFGDGWISMRRGGGKLTDKKIGALFEAKGYARERLTVDGKSTRGYKGLRLLTKTERPHVFAVQRINPLTQPSGSRD